MKIFYHMDDDGKCAGNIAGKYCEHFDGYELEYIGINYGMEFPFNIINDNEQVIIVDYSITPNEMDMLFDITNNIVWIDHHASAIERYSYYDKEIAGIREIGKAGCVLTYEYFNPGEPVPFCVQAVGDWDIWAFRFGDDTKEFHFGLSTVDHEPWDNWDELNKYEVVKEIKKSGRSIIKYKSNVMAGYCKAYGFETEIKGLKAFAINYGFVSSDDFATINEDDYDLFVGFAYNGRRWKYSLRSSKIDCCKLAMYFGGGGHKGAAGFELDEFIL